MNLKKIYIALTDWLIIVLFSGFIFIPLLLAIVQTDISYSEMEKRPLAGFPSLHIGANNFTDFTSEVDRYYRDHFGLREFFIYRYHREMMKRFGVPGVTNVVVGKEGWFFFAGEETIEDFMGRKRMTPSQLDTLSRRIKTHQESLEKKGIYYLQVVVPNKQSIYPEYLPDYYQQEKKETRLDQVTAYLNKKEITGFLDLRSVLIAKKGGKRLYDKTDTHWNYLGTIHAYNEIIRYVQKDFPEQKFFHHFKVGNKWKKNPAGDLALLSGYKDSLWEMRPIAVSGISAVEQKIDPAIRSILSLDRLQLFSTRKPGAKLRVIVLHDSFMNPMKQFLSENFAEVLYAWKYFNSETIDSVNWEAFLKVVDLFQPDIVIDEVVERRLDMFWREDDTEQ